jgi:hypothetical protein
MAICHAGGPGSAAVADIAILTAPPALRPLNDVLAAAPEGAQVVLPFQANVRGEAVYVTAVLERTAVIGASLEPWGDKRLVNRALVLVEADAVRWEPVPRRVTGRQLWARGTTRPLAPRSAQTTAPSARQAAWETCRREGCNARISVSNRRGECQACQRVCPTCGGAKDRHSDLCVRCWAARAGQRAPGERRARGGYGYRQERRAREAGGG